MVGHRVAGRQLRRFALRCLTGLARARVTSRRRRNIDLKALIFFSTNKQMQLIMLFRQQLDIAREEPVATSHVYLTSARPRIEHAARRPRERPPGRAIYFCVCLRVCVDVCQCPLACPAPRHERTPNDRQRATEQLDVQPNERPREQPNEQPREQPHDQRTVSLKHLFCVSCSAYTCRAY